jgi:hypothetical protein
MSLFPWDDQELLPGRTRILRAPLTEPIPANLNDVIDLESPYDPAGTWEDFGAAREGASYSRGIETDGYEIQQVSGLIFEDVSEVTRALSFSIAEIKPEHLQIIEEGQDPETIAAGVGTSAQKVVKFGNIADLTRYRFAFVAQRSALSGVVTETDASTRGRLVAGILLSANLSADDVEIPLEKGSLAHASVTFNGFPVSGQPDGEETGLWITEDVSTITA